jgi:N,N'-diacetylbacillosaminyl-diphospho-undecaprenol alpha-1,3-N-acetylgalactosaminyltransferase
MKAFHIVFLSHFDLNLRFRMPIMRALVKNGNRVTALVPDGPYAVYFSQENIKHKHYNISRAGLNPFKELKVVFSLFKIIKQLSPDLIHTFTAKPNIYGTLAARLAGVPVVINSVTGLGSFFTKVGRPDLMEFMLLRLYRLSGALSNATIFQNKDDVIFFRDNKLVSKEKVHLIRGSGVDLERFSLKKFSHESCINLKKCLGISPDAVVVTLMARLIWDKGIKEFCEAARQLRNNISQQFIFLLVGDFYDGNPNTIPHTYIESAVKDKKIMFTGWRDDVPAILAASDIVVLPSYYEGLSVSLMEAMAMSRSLVTTDVPGCRETVEDGWNGFLVPVRDANALARAIRKLIDDPTLREVMGRRSREKAEREFDVRFVVREHLQLYQKLLNSGMK